MRELAEVSGAAVKTLYNLFGDKTSLIHEAVRELFAERIDNEAYESDDPIDLMLARTSRTARVILEIPNFARAMARSYFAEADRSSSVDNLHDRTRNSLLEQIGHMKAKGQISPKVHVGTLADIAAFQAFAVVAKWAQGVIPDRRLASAMRTASLLVLSAATIGKTRDRVMDLLALESPLSGHDRSL